MGEQEREFLREGDSDRGDVHVAETYGHGAVVMPFSGQGVGWSVWVDEFHNRLIWCLLVEFCSCAIVRGIGYRIS